MAERLRAGVWVAAYVRRLNDACVTAMLRARGDDGSGGVLIKVVDRTGAATLFSPAMGMDGARVWLATSCADDAAAEARIVKARGRDPDLWVVEVEQPDGDPLLDEPVERLG